MFAMFFIISVSAFSFKGIFCNSMKNYLPGKKYFCHSENPKLLCIRKGEWFCFKTYLLFKWIIFMKKKDLLGGKVEHYPNNSTKSPRRFRKRFYWRYDRFIRSLNPNSELKMQNKNQRRQNRGWFHHKTIKSAYKLVVSGFWGLWLRC